MDDTSVAGLFPAEPAGTAVRRANCLTLVRRTTLAPWKPELQQVLWWKTTVNRITGVMACPAAEHPLPDQHSSKDADLRGGIRDARKGGWRRDSRRELRGRGVVSRVLRTRRQRR